MEIKKYVNRMAKDREDSLKQIVAVSKRRGFVFPGSDIYGGLSNTFDYGPYGIEVLQNLKRLWWEYFVHRREDVVGLDSSILLNPTVWEASGHVGNFSDPLMDCKQCKTRIRVDHFLEERKGDVMFAIGARLDDRLTGAFDTFAPNAKIIHVDLDPAEMGKNITIHTPVIGDALLTLKMLLPQVQPNEHPAWLTQIADWKSESTDRDIIAQETDELVAPYIMRQLWHATDEGDATVVSDVGQHQMWEAQYFHHTKRRSLLTSGGLGTMGYGLPAAIGAQMGLPDEEIWVVAGDGGFQMTMIELSTVMQERLPIKIAIINNGFLGMVRQWQDVFYNKRHAGTPLFNPDFVKLAEAYGIAAKSVTRKEDVYNAIKEAQAHDGPYLLDFQVEEFTNVYPMVAPGKSNADMIRRPMPNMEGEE